MDSGCGMSGGKCVGPMCRRGLKERRSVEGKFIRTAGALPGVGGGPRSRAGPTEATDRRIAGIPLALLATAHASCVQEHLLSVVNSSRCLILSYVRKRIGT